MNGNGVVSESFSSRSHVDVSLARPSMCEKVKYGKTWFDAPKGMSEFVAQSKVFQCVGSGSLTNK